jgi:superfamily II DNA or RNA helicase
MPAERLPPGLYERLLSLGLDREVQALDRARFAAQTQSPADTERPRLLARYVHQLLLLALDAQKGKDADIRQLDLCRRVLDQLIAKDTGLDADDHLATPAALLTALTEQAGLGTNALHPTAIPLGAGDLLVNAPGEPGLGQTLQTEIPSADRIDLLCAFIKWNGFRVLQDALRAHLDRGRSMRVITTIYIGATERRAIDELARLGARVKVSYETRNTRLHAKAWHFHRESGFSTAYVGSSNLSGAALLEGLEWNVRVSQAETPALLDKLRATFEGYWADAQFEDYDPSRDAERLDGALVLARGSGRDHITAIPTYELRPYPFQTEILDKLHAERERHGRHKNLIVAATGTGKTLIAAFDYRRLGQDGRWPSLLFVAHRREILTQSLDVFRAVLRDGAFGELYVDGQKPKEGRHVFASIQGLARFDLDRIRPADFDVVIVDEFHHAEAPTYRRLLDHLRPKELLGLTATPERSDGESVVKWFDGRIAAELRLWEALQRGLLSPFQYFGIHDSVDLSTVRWTRGGYELADLDKLYTGNDRRVSLVLKALRDRVLDVRRMRALGFCVSVAHAHYMALRFTKAGIPAVAVSAETDSEERTDALRKLRAREVNVVFAVDLFNEGVDVPEIDTVLFLRPTESATVFLQQLGRGLRMVNGKDCLTALDFIGQQHQRFRFDLRFRALTGSTRAGLKQDIDQGFPFLPAGSSIQLDRVATQAVLDNLRAAINARFGSLVAEVKSLPPADRTLAGFLSATGLDLEDVYRRPGWTWTRLMREAGHATPAAGPSEEELTRGVQRLLHVDDPEWLSFLKASLASTTPPLIDGLSRREQRILTGLHFALWSDKTARKADLQLSMERIWAHAAIRDELRQLLALLDDRAPIAPTPLAGLLGWEHPVPLSVHSAYQLSDILAAFGLMTPSKPHLIREGVKFDKASRSDLFFVTLDKSEKQYSPTTRYRDYAISRDLFHWESQSTTTVRSKTGQRYIHHRARGTNVLLFVREAKKDGSRTQPYVFVGPADYESHAGDRPIAITWRLRLPMPPGLFEESRVAAG